MSIDRLHILQASGQGAMMGRSNTSTPIAGRPWRPNAIAQAALKKPRRLERLGNEMVEQGRTLPYHILF